MVDLFDEARVIQNLQMQHNSSVKKTKSKWIISFIQLMSIREITTAVQLLSNPSKSNGILCLENVIRSQNVREKLLSLHHNSAELA
ncbi:hypothetical protein GJ496_000490 [Pomphorhynchus laevis]|nr:hypothetical protein GJ496_000490 [Pomphorhynchus laevis]